MKVGSLIKYEYGMLGGKCIEFGVITGRVKAGSMLCWRVRWDSGHIRDYTTMIIEGFDLLEE